MSESISIGWFGPTTGCWEWILGHFQDKVILREQDLPSWIDRCRPSPSADPSTKRIGSQSKLILACDSRHESTIGLTQGMEQLLAPIPWCLLLGTDWVGHRRTFPLPESRQSFYWYELYDRVLPWLTSNLGSLDVQVAPVELGAPNAKRKVSPRVQHWIDTSTDLAARRKKRTIDSQHANNPMALVITETADARQLWMESLGRRGIQCAATSPSQLDVWLQPHLIVVDLESPPLALAQAQQPEDDVKQNVVQQLGMRYPNALQIVTDAFPRWERWETLAQLGADLLVAKPYAIDGLLATAMMVA